MFIITKSEVRINEQILAPEVRLIDENGEQKGVIDLQEALNYAQQADLDLVEVSPEANPPVCRVMDYSKYKYQQEKKTRQSRKGHKTTQLKEIKIRPKIGIHDLKVKINHIREFLERGNRVKITIMFRGREMAHADLGVEILENIKEEFKEISSVDELPKFEGSNMGILLIPKKK